MASVSSFLFVVHHQWMSIMVYSFGVSDQEGPLSVVSVFYTQEGNDELRKKRISWIVSKLATAVSFHVKVASQLTPDSPYASSVVPLPPPHPHPLAHLMALVSSRGSPTPLLLKEPISFSFSLSSASFWLHRDFHGGSGVFQITPSELFRTPKTLLWLRFSSYRPFFPIVSPR